MELYQQLISGVVSNTKELLMFGIGLVILERLLPAYRGQKHFGKSSLIDLAYSYILTLSTPFFIAVPVSAAYALIKWSPTLDGLYGLILVNLSLPMQVLLAIVAVDLVAYWRHRIMHMKYLWPIHAIHHCSSKLTWLSTERFHLLNHIVTMSIGAILITIAFGPEAALYSAMARRFYNLFIHANVRIDYGPLGYIFVSPRFHHWHHSSHPEAINCNYTTFFSFFDLIFGTFYLPKDKSFPTELGERDRIPESLGAQFMYPFRVWGRMLRGEPGRLREGRV